MSASAKNSAQCAESRDDSRSESRARRVRENNVALIVFSVATFIFAQQASAGILRHSPRPLGLYSGMSLKAALARLAKLGAKRVKQQSRTERFVPGKKFDAIRVTARFDASPKLPRKVKIFFFNNKLLALRLYDPPAGFGARLGKPDIASPDGERRVWVDKRRLRFAGCRRSRCEMINLAPLLGAKGITRAELQRLLTSVTKKERDRINRRSSNKTPPSSAPPAGNTSETPVR